MPTTKTTTPKTTTSKSGVGTKPPMPVAKQAMPATKPAPPVAKTMPANKKAEIAADHAMLDDPAMIADILTTQKGLIKLYGTALCEGSNEKFRHLCNTHLTEISSDQFDSFLYMSSRNLYPTAPAPAPKLTEAKQRYKATQIKMKG